MARGGTALLRILLLFQMELLNSGSSLSRRLTTQRLSLIGSAAPDRPDLGKQTERFSLPPGNLSLQVKFEAMCKARCQVCFPAIRPMGKLRTSTFFVSLVDSVRYSENKHFSSKIFSFFLFLNYWCKGHTALNPWYEQMHLWELNATWHKNQPDVQFLIMLLAGCCFLDSDSLLKVGNREHFH